MSALTVGEMAKHIHDLVDKHEIVVRRARRVMASRAVPEGCEVQICPVKSEVSYCVALHEIGRLLGRFQGSGAILVRERWAWHWAERNALRWSPRMERHRGDALQWYVRHRRELETPRPSEIARLKRALESGHEVHVHRVELRALKAAGAEFVELNSGAWVALRRKG